MEEDSLLYKGLYSAPTSMLSVQTPGLAFKPKLITSLNEIKNKSFDAHPQELDIQENVLHKKPLTFVKPRLIARVPTFVTPNHEESETNYNCYNCFGEFKKKEIGELDLTK